MFGGFMYLNRKFAGVFYFVMWVAFVVSQLRELDSDLSTLQIAHVFFSWSMVISIGICYLQLIRDKEVGFFGLIAIIAFFLSAITPDAVSVEYTWREEISYTVEFFLFFFPLFALRGVPIKREFGGE